MSQTVKYARVRATQDPDHGDENGLYGGAGVFFGTNVSPSVLYGKDAPLSAALVGRVKTSRGACARG